MMELLGLHFDLAEDTGELNATIHGIHATTMSHIAQLPLLANDPVG